MNSMFSSPESQEKQLMVKSIDAAEIANSHTEALIGILSAITKLSQDDTIIKLATHGKNVASTMLDDMHSFCEEIQAIGLDK